MAVQEFKKQEPRQKSQILLTKGPTLTEPASEKWLCDHVSPWLLRPGGWLQLVYGTGMWAQGRELIGMAERRRTLRMPTGGCSKLTHGCTCTPGPGVAVTTLRTQSGRHSEPQAGAHEVSVPKPPGQGGPGGWGSPRCTPASPARSCSWRSSHHLTGFTCWILTVQSVGTLCYIFI